MKTTQARCCIKMYWWMCIGLMLSATIAWLITIVSEIQDFFDMRRWLIVPIIAAEILFVMWLIRRVDMMSVSKVHFSYSFFAILNGFVIALLIGTYNVGSAYIALFVTAGMFFVMALFSSATRIVVMNIFAMFLFWLFGVTFMMITGLIIDIDRVDYVLSAILITIFALLTIYNTRQIQTDCYHRSMSHNDCGLHNATRLYLSFINAPLNVLRISKNQ